MPRAHSPLEIFACAEAHNIGWMPWAVDDPSNATSDQSGFAMFKDAQTGGFGTGDPAQLTDFGRLTVTDPVYALKALGTYASIF